MEVPVDADISCHFQENDRGTLRCLAARNSDRSNTDIVTPEICYTCSAGTVYREVGCDQVSPYLEVVSLPSLNKGYVARSHVFELNCGIKKRQTTLEECRACPLVPAETTRELISSTMGLFQAQGFNSAYQDLVDARNDLRDCDYDDAIGKSISCLESTMRCIHEELGVELPADKAVKGLWKSTKRILYFDEITTEAKEAVVSLVGSLSGAVGHLGAMRNSLSDSHGKGLVPVELSEALAELSINATATVSTVIIRRFRQIQEE